MIEIENVSLTIKKTTILSDISVSFADGQIYGLIGRNGSGKTVLMKCICGFMQPSAGTITVNGSVIGRDRDFLSDAGIIIENPTFVKYYSGFKNLKILADINKKINDDVIRDTIRLVGLDPEMRLHVGKYSLGMKQRLGLAQAIMEDPSIIILDEPMNGLDKEGVSQMRECLLNLKKAGKTIILASHLSEDIDVLCDTVCEMDHGRLTKLR